MVTMKEAETLITALVPFNAGTLTGGWERYDDTSNGYVVRSYGVLIAETYNNYNGLSTDAYSFSKTTSKHANMVKRAWQLT
jgi:hypothetical protein